MASSYGTGIPGRTGIANLILENGKVDLNAADEYGNTPLIWAAISEDEEAAAFLVREGADINRSDAKKWTPLHWAAVRHRIRVMKILLEKEGLDLSPQDVNGVTPLHLACQTYHYRGVRYENRREAIKLLLDAGADTNIKENNGATALSLGIRKSYLTHEEIKLFVLKGAFLDKYDYIRIPTCSVLKDVELCTQSVVNKFNNQSLPTLNSIAYFAKRLPNVNNFKLGARHIDEVENLVKCEIERKNFCDVMNVRPIALSALCVLSLITCQSGKKRAASTGLGHSPIKKNRS